MHELASGPSEASISRHIYQSIAVTPVVQTVELSEEGRSFLHHLFLAFDENQDGLLSDAEQSEMF